MKSIIIFDLDGTLAKSKSAMDAEMATLFARLLAVVRVAIISGGDYPQFQQQVLAHLPAGATLGNLSLLPTCGTRFFQYDGSDWKKLYSEDLSGEQKHRIVAALEAAVTESGFQPQQSWGERIEDRESQITYSALGQQAPYEEKSTGIPTSASAKRSRRCSTSPCPTSRSASVDRHRST